MFMSEWVENRSQAIAVVNRLQREREKEMGGGGATWGVAEPYTCSKKG